MLFTSLIITISISSNVIVASAALYFTNHSMQLLSDSVIGQLAVEVANHIKST